MFEKIEYKTELWVYAKLYTENIRYFSSNEKIRQFY